MKTYLRIVVIAAVFMFARSGTCDLWAQANTTAPGILHIAQSRTVSQGSQNGFPTFLAMYKVLDAGKSPAGVISLTGTLSLKNFTPTFSEALWLLVYWQGECPAHDIDLTQSAGTLWADIVKNPSQSDSSFPVNLVFPRPLPATGCIGLYFGGGPVIDGKTTMSADLDLAYKPMASNPNTIVNLGSEYCFGQDWGCQNATQIDGEAFAVPTPLSKNGHLLEIYGNISDSTFDGTTNYGPIPAGTSWGSINDFYLLPGGCGIFAENLNSQGFPNPAPLSTLHAWLPKDALHLVSVPQVDRIAPGETGKAALQNQVESIFSAPVKVNAGDCLVVIFGRTGNGATDNETQVNALMGP